MRDPNEKWDIRCDAKMEADHKTVDFYVTDNIQADGQEYNCETGRMERVESPTSQRFFVEHLQGVGPGDRINLYINSMGGSVKEALGIGNVLRRTGAEIWAYNDGWAASAAGLLMMFADHSVMPRNTVMMVHHARWAAYGNPTELRKSADDLEVVNMAAIQQYLIKANGKMNDAQLAVLLKESRWLTAEDCMELGLADEYGDADVDLGEMAERFKTVKAQAASTADAAIFDNPPDALAKMLEDTPAEPPTPTPPPKEEPEPQKACLAASLLASLLKE